jgi:DNA helicase-2/ATP-dependent DNA helicase PcrA
LHDAVPSVAGKAGTLLTGFVNLIQEMRQASQGMNLREIVQLVIERSGLIDHYRTEREGADRIENLEELVNAAESFVAQEGFGRDAPGVEVADGLDAETGETLSPLVAFLTHAALEAGDNQAQAGQDAIQLMTVHAAKGLEFDAVFITGLEEGLFPHENSLSSSEGLEEERRLMYVALTRARKRLYLSHAQTRMLHGQTRYNIPSRFYDEMPEHTLKWVSQRQAPARWDANGWDSPSKTSPPAWGNAPVVSKAASDGAYAWLRSGVQVFHNKFGEGTVLALEGTGDDARAQISFPRHGTKWLALSVAKLTQV